MRAAPVVQKRRHFLDVLAGLRFRLNGFVRDADVQISRKFRFELLEMPDLVLQQSILGQRPVHIE